MFFTFWLLRKVVIRIVPSSSTANHMGIGCGYPPRSIELMMIVLLERTNFRTSSSFIWIWERRDMGGSVGQSGYSILTFLLTQTD